MRITPPKPQTPGSDSSAPGQPSPLAPSALIEILQGQSIVTAGVSASRLYPDAAELALTGGRRITARSSALALNGAPVTGALGVSAVHGPLDARALEPEAIAQMLCGQSVERVRVTGHPGTSSAYHLLIVLDGGNQLAIQAHALPAGAGIPVLDFTVCGEQSDTARGDTFDHAGELSVP
jgi:hypothetical protein